MADLTLYTNPLSRGRMAHWMLEEVGQPYEARVLDFSKGEHRSAEYLAINPMGKIPTLLHGKTIITETAAICTYLADAFPGANLAPALDDPKRADYYRWLFFGAGCLEAAIIDRATERPDPAMPGALGYGSYERMMKTLVAALGDGPWFLGEKFSTVDVYLGSQIGWGMMMGTITDEPTLAAHAARCAERPAWKRTNAQCKAQAAELKAGEG